MCGIAGSFDLVGGRPSDEDVVARMTDVLVHRGPDDAGMLVEAPVVLGHRRLSIIDLSPGGHQPMQSHDGSLWITYNGEIYNYKELAVELAGYGHEFRTSSDTEVLLTAYAQWGIDALTRLNGMFAFAIWDRRRRRLVCVRDRFGVKPLYYTVVDGRFRFASEIKALFADSAVPRRPNDDRVKDFLAFGIIDHTAETLFEGVTQLPAGCWLAVEAGSVGEPRRWYEPIPADLNGRPAETLRELLVDAVSLRLRSDVPVGTTLSGGLDSSSITAIAAKLRRDAQLEPIETFSSRCSDPTIDEWPYIKPMLAATGLPSFVDFPDNDDIVAYLDHVLWHTDEPFHRATSFAHWRLSALARTRVTVLLDGQGGDEALAGYPHLFYPGFFFSNLTHGRVDRALREAWYRSAVQGTPLGRSARETVKVFLPDSIRAYKPPAWLIDPLPPPLPGRTMLGHHKYVIGTQPLPMFNHVSDRNTMAVALEARNPFLDYRVVELGLGLRAADHVRRGYTKWTLREAARPFLPAEVVDRRRKQGFTSDEAHWIRGGLGDLMEAAFSSEEFGGRGYFDPDKVQEQLASHRGGADHTEQLWRAYVTERWFRLFIDPPRADRPTPPAGSPVTRRYARDAMLRLQPV